MPPSSRADAGEHRRPPAAVLAAAHGTGEVDPLHPAASDHLRGIQVAEQQVVEQPFGQIGAARGLDLATPEGLAVGFRMTQPASIPRTRQRVQRDFDEQGPGQP